jgi:hypothetical protein
VGVGHVTVTVLSTCLVAGPVEGAIRVEVLALLLQVHSVPIADVG